MIARSLLPSVLQRSLLPGPLRRVGLIHAALMGLVMLLLGCARAAKATEATIVPKKGVEEVNLSALVMGYATRPPANANARPGGEEISVLWSRAPRLAGNMVNVAS